MGYIRGGGIVWGRLVGWMLVRVLAVADVCNISLNICGECLHLGYELGAGGD